MLCKLHNLKGNIMINLLRKEIPRSDRFDISIACTLSTPNKKLCIRGETVNISESGLLIRAKRHNISYGSPVKLELKLRDFTISMICHPTRLTAKQIGFKITNIGPMDFKKYKRFFSICDSFF